MQPAPVRVPPARSNSVRSLRSFNSANSWSNRSSISSLNYLPKSMPIGVAQQIMPMKNARAGIPLHNDLQPPRAPTPFPTRRGSEALFQNMSMPANLSARGPDGVPMLSKEFAAKIIPLAQQRGPLTDTFKTHAVAQSATDLLTTPVAQAAARDLFTPSASAVNNDFAPSRGRTGVSPAIQSRQNALRSQLKGNAQSSASKRDVAEPLRPNVINRPTSVASTTPSVIDGPNPNANRLINTALKQAGVSKPNRQGAQRVNNIAQWAAILASMGVSVADYLKDDKKQPTATATSTAPAAPQDKPADNEPPAAQPPTAPPVVTPPTIPPVVTPPTIPPDVVTPPDTTTEPPGPTNTNRGGVSSEIARPAKRARTTGTNSNR